MRRLLLLALLQVTLAVGGDWPQLRGPDGNGVASSDQAPTNWDESAVAWVIDEPGEGWSAPVVVGDRVFLTTTDWDAPGASNLRFEVVCYALGSGEEVWRRVARDAPPTQPTHRDNTYASETPVTDGERLYAYFGMNGLYCYTLDGELVWEKDLGSYPMDHGWGTSSSPALADGRVFVQIDNVDQSFVVALDAETGDEVWRTDRADEVSTWSTPVVWRHAGRTELVLGGKTVRSYDPATGRELWSMEIGGRSSATAAPVGEVLYIGSEDRSARGGTPGGLFAVKAGAAGEIDVTDPADPRLAWANLRGAIGISSPLVVDGHIYVPERRGGVLRIHDAATGEQTDRTRLPGGGVFWASPLAIGGKVYVLDERGKTFVLEPSSEADVLNTCSLPGRFWGTPAVANGSLLLRSADKLYCVRSDAG